MLDGVWIAGHKPSFPGWDILRTVGGEIQEVSAFAERRSCREGEPVLVAGRFEQGGLFHVNFYRVQRQPSWRLTAIGSGGRAELLFPLGWNGPAFLDWHDADGEPHEEYWQRWDPWPALIEAFEQIVEKTAAPRRHSRSRPGKTPFALWSWTTRPAAASSGGVRACWSIRKRARKSASKAP